ncbi:MAG: ribonucleoside triphosphate reductase [Bacillota bacterium]
MLEKIRKRDGQIVPFDQDKITIAIFKAAKAVGGSDFDRARYLSDQAVAILEENFKDLIPAVEEIQDVVEKVLIECGHAKTAKAYILYRKQRTEIRDFQSLMVNTGKMIQEYLDRHDWRVNENSNMNYSLQGLNNHIIAGITQKYWIEKIYPTEIRSAHENGDMHIHDLGLLAPYCCGWSIEDLLEKGFRGAPQKVTSNPPRHFRTALGQLINFFYTLQGECYAEDTQVLTDSGWKYFYAVSEGDQVYTLNNETNEVEIQKPVRYFEYDYNGTMYHFNNSKVNLFVTPNHNMVVDQYSPYNGARYLRKIIKARDFNPNIDFIPKQAEWLGNEKEVFFLPAIEIEYYRNYGKIYEKRIREKKEIHMDDWLAFFGFWLAEGSTYLHKRDRHNRNKVYYEYQVRIHQNEGETASEFERILQRLPFKYSKKQDKKKIEFCIWDKQLFSYLRQFGKAGNKFIPQEIKSLSKRQLEILFDWLMKGNGYTGHGNTTYNTKSERLADDVQELVMKLSYASSIYKRKKGNASWFVVSISKNQRNYIRNGVEKKEYKGKVYCLEVPNHTLYVRRKGKPAWCGNSAGAQAIANFDTYLAPFIRYDGIGYREVKQALQEFVFNLNVPTRVGFQTPFINITLDVTVPSILADQPVMVGGTLQKETYSEFQKEMNLINMAFCEVMMAGDADGRIFTFPIPTYNVTSEFFENPVSENIMEMTAKYGIPYFANFINSDLSPDDVRSMCCRLRIDNRELRRRGGGLFGANPLTGSIGVVTINLPRIGYKANTLDDFLRRVEEVAILAKESLVTKRQVLEQLTENGLYPYSKYFLRDVYSRFGEYWANHFNTIGVIGMNEALLNFMGEDITTPAGQAAANTILNHLRSILIQFQEETGQMFNLEATPGEGTSYRLALLDKELYPGIVTSGEAEPYYTNSTQLPVNHTDDLFTALDLQDDLQTKYTGGTVFHVFLGEKVENTGACKKLISKVFSLYKLPYLSITPTFSVCSTHKYLSGEQPLCPYCGQETEIWSRVVGYYRPVQNWNRGKKEEFRQRKTLKVKANPLHGC